MTAHPFSRFASLFLVAVGTLVLAGWVLDIHLLKGLSGSITMKANAAIGLLAAGVALGGVRATGAWRPRIGRAAAIVAGTIGALTLSQHVFGWNLGIDELLFREGPGSPATMSPGRMGPNASTSLMLAGVALFCLYRGDRLAVASAQALGAVVTVFALVPVVGYMYGAAQLYAVARITGIAIHTGLALLVLGLGILAARPDTGPVAALLSAAPHGVMARRLLIAAVVVPIGLGYLRLAGERYGWYDTAFGAASFAVAVVVLLSLTIWGTAIALGRSDRRRQSIEAARDALLVSEREARERAERADRAKDEFIAALSHELRTPLNAVVGWMQMLQEGVLPDASRVRATDAIARNAGVLARLIEDLLDTSRIATGQLAVAREPVDVCAVARAAVDSVLPAASAKDVHVALTAAPDVPALLGDARRLQQVLWNLLTNAIRFSSPGGTVAIDVAGGGASVTIRVRDEGAGIDPTFLPYVFDRFRQHGTAAGTASGGLGLGLFIVRRLVQEHGGTIRADSDGNGRGAVFTIELPAVAAGRDVPATSATSA
jgi:signal transduction histidine kinase